MLKLSARINGHGELPPVDELLAFIQQERLQLRQQVEIIRQGGEVAVGARSEFLYRERFNLSLADVGLLKGPNAYRAIGGSAEKKNVCMYVCMCVCITHGLVHCCPWRDIES